MNEIEKIIKKDLIKRGFKDIAERVDWGSTAKALEQFVINAIPKERECYIHGYGKPKPLDGGCNCLEVKIFNECIAQLKKGLK